MYFKILVPLLFASVAQGSGYFPSIGGPWSRYTTTTPSPTQEGQGVNLPATEAPPPPAVTFVPRPRPIPEQSSEGNNLNAESQTEGQTQDEGNFLIVIDPMTGERFQIPKQTFWDRFGHRQVQHQGQGLGQFSRYGQGLNNRQLRRSRRSVEKADSIVLLNSNEHEEELDSLPMSDEMLFNMNHLNSDSEENYKSYEFHSSADLFKMFFPTLKLDDGHNNMIYTYTFHRPIFVREKDDKKISCTTEKETSTTPQETTTLREIKIEETTLEIQAEMITEVPTTLKNDYDSTSESSPSPK